MNRSCNLSENAFVSPQSLHESSIQLIPTGIFQRLGVSE